MRVDLRWQSPSAAHSLPMAVSTIDRHVYNHVTLNKVHGLERSHFYFRTCLSTWKTYRPTSPGVPSKILLDGSKALLATA